jgi:ABC-type thiamine transport system ATPase subunit
MAIPSATTEDAYIAVMGVTGSGKSSLIKLITGWDIPVGHDLRSCTPFLRPSFSPLSKGGY